MTTLLPHGWEGSKSELTTTNRERKIGAKLKRVYKPPSRGPSDSVEQICLGCNPDRNSFSSVLPGVPDCKNCILCVGERMQQLTIAHWENAQKASAMESTTQDRASIMRAKLPVGAIVKAAFGCTDLTDLKRN
ncbi:hypothetical protein ZHAS_00008685 [Anopheles sinensis]|uniref:Uncharacterized protein n=1 Tax=Anopheles sinensis TaxID=74873 RepID=A0A084VT44_ANOSI|nr:hypothetical protein ZHAS_00008685 [Anopheles sinensis]